MRRRGDRPPRRTTRRGRPSRERSERALVGVTARVASSRRCSSVVTDVEVLLHSCPFANAAVADPDIVCELHHGIAIGVAEHVGGITIDGLDRDDPRRAPCRLRRPPRRPPTTVTSPPTTSEGEHDDAATSVHAALPQARRPVALAAGIALVGGACTSDRLRRRPPRHERHHASDGAANRRTSPAPSTSAAATCTSSARVRVRRR